MKLLTQEYRENWRTASKVLFRVVSTYFVLYTFFTIFGELFEIPFRAIGTSVFNIDYEYAVSGKGSGDHTYAYLTLFVSVVFTVILASVWSILDRNRKSYNKLFYWFLVFLRVALIASMLLYGFVKIFKLQFPAASLTRLLDPLGDFSPMGLAWTYMGFSKGFNVFVGFMEVLGALFLIPRRTQTLGSFIIIGVMTQVAMMNFCYDIPVKLFSMHLIAMALVIFITDHRFIDVFIKNKAVEKYKYFRPVENPQYHKIVFWIKSVGLFFLIAFISFNFYTTESHRGEDRKKPALYGIWEASTFIKNGDTLQPLITDTYRWRYLIVDVKDKANVKTMDDGIHSYQFITDTTTEKIKMYKENADSLYFNFRYKNPNPEFLQLDGKIGKDRLQIFFSRIDHDKFNLNSRGFHWINERPFNK